MHSFTQFIAPPPELGQREKNQFPSVYSLLTDWFSASKTLELIANTPNKASYSSSVEKSGVVGRARNLGITKEKSLSPQGNKKSRETGVPT